jgi:hypothetical protein
MSNMNDPQLSFFCILELDWKREKQSHGSGRSGYSGSVIRASPCQLKLKLLEC